MLFLIREYSSELVLQPPIFVRILCMNLSIGKYRKMSRLLFGYIAWIAAKKQKRNRIMKKKEKEKRKNSRKCKLRKTFVQASDIPDSVSSRSTSIMTVKGIHRQPIEVRRML